ncbi:MAG: hypothetical protein U0Y82_11795 [Thermoleophilia bacterium]
MATTGLWRRAGAMHVASLLMLCAVAATGRAASLPAEPVAPTGLDPAGWSNPSGVAVDRLGNLYVADTNNSRVVRVATDGTATLVVPVGVSPAGWNTPYGVAVDASDDVFVADTSNNRVVEVAPDGTTTVITPTGLAPDHWTHPFGLTVGPAGDLLVADTSNNRVVRISPGGGATTLEAAGLVPSTWSLPRGVAIDPQGVPYVAGNYDNRVVRLTAGAAAALQPTGLTPATWNQPFGVAVDGTGTAFVADGVGDRVVRLSPGAAAVALTPAGITPAGWDAPSGVAVAPGGGLYVADARNNRVVHLGVRTAPVVTAQPQDLTVAAGTTATFSVTAVATPAPTVRWQRSTDGGATFADIPGAAGSTLTLTGVTTAISGTRYRAVIGNGTAPDAVSSAATLTVRAAAQAPSSSTPAGSNPTFTSPSGDTPAAATPDPATPATGGLPGQLVDAPVGPVRLGADGAVRLSLSLRFGGPGTYTLIITGPHGARLPWLAGSRVGTRTLAHRTSAVVITAPAGVQSLRVRLRWRPRAGSVLRVVHRGTGVLTVSTIPLRIRSSSRTG